MRFLSKEPNKKKLIPALFLHIQKTAGTSILDNVRPYYGTSMVSHGDFIGNGPSKFLDTLFISGHFGYEYAKDYISSRYSFTFLRNPRERVISFYYYCRNVNNDDFNIYKIARTRNLLGFLEAASENPLIRKNVFNNQVWQLSYGFKLRDKNTLLDCKEAWQLPPNDLLELSINHLDEFSHIGFTESFEQDRNIILNNLQLPTPKDNVVKNATSNRPKFSELPKNVKDLIADLTDLDQQLYDTAIARKMMAIKHDNLDR